MITPDRTTYGNSGLPGDWPVRVWRLWCDRVAPLFKRGETCSSARYFETPFEEGFYYVVEPGGVSRFVKWGLVRAQRI